MYHRVGGLVNITVETCYTFQYLTIFLSDYMNASIEPALLALRYGMEYLMHHPYESIMYPINKMFKTNPTSIFLKMRRCRNQEYSNFLRTYFDAYHARDVY